MVDEACGMQIRGEHSACTIVVFLRGGLTLVCGIDGTKLIDLAVASNRQFVVVRIVAHVALRLSDQLGVIHELLLHGCRGRRLQMASGDKIPKSLAVRRELLLLIVVGRLEVGSATSSSACRRSTEVPLHIIGLLLVTVDLRGDGCLAFRLARVTHFSAILVVRCEFPLTLSL